MPANQEQTRQAALTRAAILSAAHDLFRSQGYSETSTEEIVARAAVTRGALYHHFADKKALFRAVHESLQRDFIDQYLAHTAGQRRDWQWLEGAVHLFLDAALEPDLRRIVLIDGPAVLGWDTWQALANRYAFALFEDVIHSAIEDGTIRPLPPAPLAHMLLSAFQTAGVLIARSSDPLTTRHEVRAVVDGLFDGLRLAPQAAPIESSTRPDTTLSRRSRGRG